MEEENKDIVEDTDADTEDVVESEENDTETEVEDTDADTRDIERNSAAEFSALMERLEILEKMVQNLSGSITSIKDAQAVLIENGAVVQDNTPLDEVDDLDDFRSIADLDLTL